MWPQYEHQVCVCVCVCVCVSVCVSVCVINVLPMPTSHRRFPICFEEWIDMGFALNTGRSCRAMWPRQKQRQPLCLKHRFSMSNKVENELQAPETGIVSVAADKRTSRSESFANIRERFNKKDHVSVPHSNRGWEIIISANNWGKHSCRRQTALAITNAAIAL